jgi:hypothetical protein
MEAPLNWAKRLSKWDKIDFLADAQATVEAWNDGDTSSGRIEYDWAGPFISITSSEGNEYPFRAWRINGKIHADYEEPGFIEMSDEDFTWAFSNS